MKKLFLVFILLLAGLGAAAYWLYSSMTTPVPHAKADEVVKITKGTAPADVVNQLATEGILPASAATRLYLRLFGDASKIQAGEYKFKSPISPLDVLKEMERGETQTTRLTIPEGFTKFDIAKRIVNSFPQNPPVTEADVLELMSDTSLIKDISPEAKDLEGYMYPSTYSVPKGAKAADIIKMTVDQFRAFWKPEWTGKAKAMGRTPHQMITIASLIETETGVESERPTVAGIINNRLSKGIPLGIDQTNVYIAKMRGKWDGTIHASDLAVDSPYNTRIKTGLPPGPISSVTESSLKAALDPGTNDYLYYVRNVDMNDGSHWFYSSAAEFEKGKAKYQAWLEKEREAKRAAEAGQK